MISIISGIHPIHMYICHSIRYYMWCFSMLGPFKARECGLSSDWGKPIILFFQVIEIASGHVVLMVYDMMLVMRLYRPLISTVWPLGGQQISETRNIVYGTLAYILIGMACVIRRHDIDIPLWSQNVNVRTRRLPKPTAMASRDTTEQLQTEIITL